MPYHSNNVVEKYILEIIARSRSIQGRCNHLLSKHFASDPPKNLARTIVRICKYLEDVVNSIYTSVDITSFSEEELQIFMKILQDTDYAIHDLGSEVRFIDGSLTQKLPWSIIKPIEKFTKKLIPGIEIMLRPQWRYNYSVVTNDLRQVYLERLAEYQDFVPDISLKNDVLKDLQNPFHIISFPSLERKNILLHCLIGHEIGHLISRQYFTKDTEDEFVLTIREDINHFVEQSLQGLDEPELFLQNKKKIIQRQYLEKATRAWERGLEEILADIVGTLLFGPAMIFSALEIAIQDSLDALPAFENNFYPPWRLRLREILKVIEDPSQEFIPLPKSIFTLDQVIEHVESQFKIIKEITKNKNDQDLIEKDQILKIAYNEINKHIDKAKTMFHDILKDSLVKSSTLYKKLPHLIERLDIGIPPNAHEEILSDRVPATIVEIINAAWFHKITWKEKVFSKEGVFNENVLNKRDRMNRLTLKAIEYADIEDDYRKYLKKL